MNESGQLVLKPGREKSLKKRHPWIFSGAIAEKRGDLAPGDVAAVYSSKGEFLAQAAYSPDSQIRGRVWSWNEDDTVGMDFIRGRIEEAANRRRSLLESGITNAVRLVHAESDLVPGLIIDQYAQTAVVQLLSWGIEVWRDEITEILLSMPGISCVYERSDAKVRTLEGLESRVGLLGGDGFSDTVEITEHGINYRVAIGEGHKTGFYLDQRSNRKMVRDLAEEKDVLDCFAYTGGFGLSAAMGGAKSVELVEESARSIELGKQNVEINQINDSKFKWIAADVFQQLRTYRDSRREFDLIILDPPKFAPTRSNIEKAARGYKDINLLAFKLLRPGGTLVTFSCSGGVDADLFQKIVAGAGVDAGVQAQIQMRLSQDADHPVGLHFPEGEYLKGLVCNLF